MSEVCDRGTALWAHGPSMAGKLSALSVDIEVDPASGNCIFKIGAVRSDSILHLNFDVDRQDKASISRRIDAITEGARVLVGYDLRQHDLPELQRQCPGLACLADRDLAGAPDQRFALALALSWIRVSGGNSVLPARVHKSLQQVRALIAQLCEQDCGDDQWPIDTYPRRPVAHNEDR